MIASPCHSYSVADIGMGLLPIQRLQMIINHNTLGELLHVRSTKSIAQPSLSDENDLKYLVFVGIDIRQHTQLFQCIGRHVLCFIDDQNGAFVLAVLLQKKVEKIMEHLDLLLAAMFQVEGEQYPLHQFPE